MIPPSFQDGMCFGNNQTLRVWLISGCPLGTSVSLRFQLREANGVANAFLPEESWNA